MQEIVLASASPRRRELLSLMGIPFRVDPSSVDETTILADHPRTFALRAAFAKANDVAGKQAEGTWILAADTVVTLRMRLFGKPADDFDAERMLRTLSGQTHEVITGCALVSAGGNNSLLRAISTRVRFRELTDVDISRYLETGEPMDKAGAYGIQGAGGELVDEIEGDYFNVVGLPCEAVEELFDDAGIAHSIRQPTPPRRWR